MLGRYLLSLEGVIGQVERNAALGPRIIQVARLVLTRMLPAAIAALDMAGVPEWGERLQRCLMVAHSKSDVLVEIVGLCHAIARMDVRAELTMEEDEND